MVRSPCLLWYAEKRNATVASSKENCARRSVTFTLFDKAPSKGQARCIWPGEVGDGGIYSYTWFSRYVIAAMLVDKNKRFLISSFC